MGRERRGVERKVGDPPRLGEDVDKKLGSRRGGANLLADLASGRRYPNRCVKRLHGKTRGREHGHVVGVERREAPERVVAELIAARDARGQNEEPEHQRRQNSPLAYRWPRDQAREWAGQEHAGPPLVLPVGVAELRKTACLLPPGQAL